MNTHVPVFLEEAIRMLKVQPDGRYADLTLGRGGHASAILEQLTSGQLFGFDQDEAAIASLKSRWSDRLNVHMFHDNFRNLDQYLSDDLHYKMNGFLLDLGVSSPQFDTPERGFSYRFDGPLDMRMDQRQSVTAASILATYDVKMLTHIFKTYADETFAFPLAKAIVQQRMEKPLRTTFELVELIKRVKPKKALQKKGHPAKQVFQALRMEVNQEMQTLEATLLKLANYITVGGRIAVITFHSTEDRLVKKIFRSWTVVEGDRHGPALRPSDIPEPLFAVVEPYPLKPSDNEIARNPRSESATLRVIERRRYAA